MVDILPAANLRVRGAPSTHATMMRLASGLVSSKVGVLDLINGYRAEGIRVGELYDSHQENWFGSVAKGQRHSIQATIA